MEPKISNKNKLSEFINSRTQNYMIDPKRKSEMIQSEMIINDPDTLHSLINDPFERDKEISKIIKRKSNKSSTNYKNADFKKKNQRYLCR